jgi:hypothetical protein
LPRLDGRCGSWILREQRSTLIHAHKHKHIHIHTYKRTPTHAQLLFTGHTSAGFFFFFYIYLEGILVPCRPRSLEFRLSFIFFFFSLSLSRPAIRSPISTTTTITRSVPRPPPTQVPDNRRIRTDFRLHALSQPRLREESPRQERYLVGRVRTVRPDDT